MCQSADHSSGRPAKAAKWAKVKPPVAMPAGPPPASPSDSARVISNG